MKTWRAITVVFAKEVIDNLRDRRAVMIGLVYPLLAPLLIGTMILIIGGIVVPEADGGNKKPVFVQGAGFAPPLAAYLDQRGVPIRPVFGDAEAAVQRGDAENIIVIPEDFLEKFDAKKPADIKVLVNSSRLPSLIELSYTFGLLNDFNRMLGNSRLKDLGIDPSVALPLMISSVNVASSRSLVDFFLFMVPPFIVFTVFMGGVYLAIDTTSGERERGTLEPLLINPVERWAFMFGKFLAALLFTAFAVVVQLVAFKLVFALVAEPGSVIALAIRLPVMLMLFGVAVPLMMLAVGLEVVIATVTRSNKEAQTYLGLLPLVPAMPGLMLVFAPVESQSWMMTVPIFSQTLLFGQLVRGEALPWFDVVLSGSITTLGAFFFILWAARLYDREQLIFGS